MLGGFLDDPHDAVILASLFEFLDLFGHLLGLGAVLAGYLNALAGQLGTQRGRKRPILRPGGQGGKVLVVGQNSPGIQGGAVRGQQGLRIAWVDRYRR